MSQEDFNEIKEKILEKYEEGNHNVINNALDFAFDRQDVWGSNWSETHYQTFIKNLLNHKRAQHVRQSRQ